jgi:pyruvate-formate lyase-activating enzyme
MQRLDQAREAIRRLRAVTDVVMPDLGHFRNAGHRELVLSGLRRAATE